MAQLGRRRAMRAGARRAPAIGRGAVAGARRTPRAAACACASPAAGHSFSDIALTDGTDDLLERMRRRARRRPLLRARAGAGRDHDPRAQPALARTAWRWRTSETSTCRRIAGAISTATHGTGARLRNISSQVAELHARAGRRLDAALLDRARSRDVSRRPRRTRRARRDRRGDAALRARLHAARRRRARPARTTLERFEELALGNDHFEFFVFPHADVALTRTNNRTGEAPRPRGRPPPTSTTCCYQPRLRR